MTRKPSAAIEPALAGLPDIETMCGAPLLTLADFEAICGPLPTLADMETFCGPLAKLEATSIGEPAELGASASKNPCARKITAGQKAMALAFAYPDDDRRGRGRKGKAAEVSGFSQDYLRKARTILRWSWTRAADVLTGAISFDRALTEMNAETARSRDNK